MSDAVLVAVIGGCVTVVTVALARLSSHLDLARAMQVLRRAQHELHDQLTALDRRVADLERRLPGRPGEHRPH